MMSTVKCMLAWLRNVNIAILVSHVSWNVLTSSTLLAQPCICTIVLNGHAPISNLHCQFLCCCALLQVKISLKRRGFPSWFTLDKLIRRPQRDAYGDITYFAILVLYCLALLNSFPGTCTGGNWYWYHTLITRRFLAKLPLARWSGDFLQS